jgi:tRNA dimethylallyltransferase
MPGEKTAVLIAGPTASGKSALALEIARKRGGVIINADSMQVYRELRILTARPTPAEEAQSPHRLYGCVSAAETWSVGTWLDEARKEIAAAWEEGMVPIVVGGTGLYFKVLEQGLADIPAIPTAIRTKWRRAEGDLHGELTRRDPEGAAQLERGDRQRLVRALEVIEASGKPLRFWHSEAGEAAILKGVASERLFVNLDRALLHERTGRRFERMIDEGAIDEVRALLALKLPSSQPVMKAIGVRELGEYIHGKSTINEAVTQAQTATRQYIKRQLTWWRHQMSGWTVVGT